MRTKKAIDEAIKRGMHPNTQDEKTGDTLVHLVIQALCTRNYTEIQIPLLSLLDAGADFNVRNKQGETSLHVARRCLFNAESFYLWLKNECHVIPELVNEAGKVALPYSRDERKLISAIERGASVLELQAMLQAGSNADARKLFIERTSNNLSCVGFVRRKKEEAAQRFNVPVIKELYRLYKADEFDGILNLFLIFIQRQFSNLKSGGDLPLEARELLAILNEYPPEEIRYVLRSYADAEKHACVLCCIRRKNIDLDGLDNVKAVADEMSAGAELRLRAREFSTIALWFAVAAGLDLRNKRIVEWVLKYGDKNDKNFCALMKIFGTEVEPVVVQVEPEWRAFQSSDDGIEEMVAVDPSPQSLDPMTTFVTCIMENNIQGAKDLLTEAKINFQNASTLFAGTTVFHLVIFYNRPEIAKLLHGYFGMGWVKDENNQLPEIYINLDAQDERRTHEQIVRIYANKLIFGAVILRRIEMLCHLVMDLQCNADASSNPGVETTPLDLLIERANKIPLDELEAMVKVLVMNGAHVKLSNIENAPQELKDFLESSYNTLHGLRNVETRLPRNENIRLALIFNNMSDVEYWVEKNGIDCKVDGSPAIFIVVKYMQISRSTDAFTYFLEKGVNTEVSDAEGITLQARVEACGSPKVIKLFKEHQERAGWKSPRAVSVAVVASSSPLDPNVTFVSYIVDGEGNLEGVRRLIEEEQVSGRVVRQDFVSAGLRALHLAVLHNRPGIAEYLVKEAGCLSLPDEHGRLPIHYITFGKTDERIVALFQNELVEKFVTEENREGIEALITRGINPLPVAVAKQKREIVRALVNDSRIDVNALDVNDSRGANGFAPVMLSVMSSDLEIVKYLVEEAKANLDIVDRITGYGLLHIAVCSRQLEVVRYLIGLGLIVNLGAVGNHKTPLDLLLEGNRFPEMRDFVELLVESGAEVISENIEAAPEEIKPYLREAMGRFLHRLVLDVEYVSLPRQFVGKSRAELEFRDHEGRTPLHVAIIHNRVGIVEYLYSQHAGIDLVDDFGWLPMDYIKFGETDEKIVELFKDALALQCVADNNVDGVDVFISRGVNPLSLLRAAVLQRKAEVTTHLLMDVHCDANGCANPETEKTLLDCILEMEEFPELETYVKLLVLNGAIVKLSNVQNAPESVEQFLHNSFQTLHGIQLSWKSPREVSAAVAHEHGSPVISPRALQEILTRVEEYEQRTEALEARFK
jgi:ankyrin repeat protein